MRLAPGSLPRFLFLHDYNCLGLAERKGLVHYSFHSNFRPFFRQRPRSYHSDLPGPVCHDEILDDYKTESFPDLARNSDFFPVIIPWILDDL
jgi:hypothetical protein